MPGPAIVTWALKRAMPTCGGEQASCHRLGAAFQEPGVRPGQVYYSAEVQDHESHEAASAPSRVSSYLNLATLEYSKCDSRANHKHRRGPRRCAASS
jgi:hypothetical protein